MQTVTRELTDAPSVEPRSQIGRVLDGATLLVIAAAAAVAATGAFGSLALPRLVSLATTAAASLLVFASALNGRATDRLSWLLIGGGIVTSEVSRQVADVVGNPAETVLIALGFCTIAFGLFTLPHITASRFGMTRVFLDATAASVAVGVLAWDFGEIPADPLGHMRAAFGVFLLGATVFAALRRSPYRMDPRLLTLSIAFVVWAWIGFFPDSSQGSVMLPLAAAAIAVGSWYMRRPMARVEKAHLRPPAWVTILPYASIIPLVAVVMMRVSDVGSLGVTPLGTILVGVLLVSRQAASLKESRELVAAERDQLILSLAHQLRTPLTAVSGFVDILSDPDIELPEDERADMFRIVHDEASTVNHLVGDLSELVRDRLRSTTLVRERVDARQAIGEAIVSFFGVKAAPPPVKAQVEPFIELVADRGRLRQILVNLLSNAHLYGGGKILVVARRTDTGRVLEVHDDGPGLLPKYEKVVWERFERGGNQLNERVPGPGLGLSVVRALMAAHDGDCGYRRSEKLGGSCFWVSFPNA